MNSAGVSAGMRALANRVQRKFPDMVVHHHIRDAAGALDRGQHDGAIRHLNAAIYSLSPLQIRRAGISDDEGHVAAKRFMGEAHRHLLNVKDIEDLPAAQRAAMASAQPQRSRQFANVAELAREMGLR